MLLSEHFGPTSGEQTPSSLILDQDQLLVVAEAVVIVISRARWDLKKDQAINYAENRARDGQG
jgi:hypothetical protein